MVDYLQFCQRWITCDYANDGLPAIVPMVDYQGLMVDYLRLVQGACGNGGLPAPGA